MATTSDTDLPPVPVDLGPVSDVDPREEMELAQRLAARYRLEFIDMDTFKIDQGSLATPAPS